MCGGGVMGDFGSAIGGFAKEVLPIVSWVAQPFMLGAGAGAEAGVGAAVGEGAAETAGAGAGWVSAEGGAAYAGGAAVDAGTVGVNAGVDDLIDAGTGKVAGNAGDTATGATPPVTDDTFKKYAMYAGAAAKGVNAVASLAAPEPPKVTPPTTPPPVQEAQAADITAIRRRNSLLFGGDSPASTDITGGKVVTPNLGRVSLLGGTSRLGA